VTPEIVARYADRPLPRYTSYTITAREAPITRYLAALHAEIDWVRDGIGAPLAARHLHFGGGTPSLMRPDQFVALMEKIRNAFRLGSRSEVAIELDPRTLDQAMVAALAKGGVTRASLGVQSFDPVVQRAINRIQTFAKTAWATESLRQAGIEAVNFDLIYGLPHQTVQSCRDTVAEALTLLPDRLSVFGYAHVPGFKLHQRKIDQASLPDGPERHAQSEAIAGMLGDAGYVRIGLDHYARADDPLARASRNGTLHRNFQGYTTDGCDTLIGFGASSIGRLPRGYVQNAVLIGDYQKRVGAQGTAVAKFCAFQGQDRLRASIIERIMCDYRVDLGQLCGRFGADFEEVIGGAEGLAQLECDGLATIDRGVLEVPADARPLVRAIAAAFDEYLGHGPARHSRAI
jgi:oxygen-independent coproporphyrinogen-3 oxidase